MIYIKETKGSYNRKSLVKLFINEKPETYSNPEYTDVQCRAGAFRSVTEILEIVRTYYPKTTLLDILKIIKTLIEENAEVALVWCTQVKKVVLKYQSNQEKQFVTQYSVDRYLKKKGVDGYSIKDYQELINDL